MYSALFTTDDGDVILRASSKSGFQHDFRVHKFILSLASPVFKDLFTLPQPLDQTSNEQHQLPIIDVQECPEALDIILRLIYPGAQPPNITHPWILTASLLAADKYDIESIFPTLQEALKTFLSTRSVWVYIVASRFKFLEMVREAAEASSVRRLAWLDDRDDLELISSTDFFRLVEFVQTREYEGIQRISTILDPSHLAYTATCSHNGKDAQDYYFRLQKAVEQAFVEDPGIGTKDLIWILDKVADPPAGCEPQPRPAEWYHNCGYEDGFRCPLQPMVIRKRLSDVIGELRTNDAEMLDRFFENTSGSG